MILRHRANFFARADVGPPVHYPSATWPHRSGGRRRGWRARAGFEAQGLVAVPVGGGQRQQHTLQTNFARNFRRSFFETAQKHCNSNEAISMFEQVARELRAKLMGERPVEPQPARPNKAHTPPGTPATPQQHVVSFNPKTGATTPQPHPGTTKTADPQRICGFIVREGGVEPPLHHWNTDLNRARLPIPPLARTQKE